MTIDARYLMSPSLQQYFVDKDTGFPLAAGEVYFFEDNNRTQPKSVYKLSGSPPNYSFVPIGNKITLSSVGTMQDDLQNDFIPYVLPEDDEGNLQLYYVEIYSAGGPLNGILQFVREAWPPEAVTSATNQGQDSTLNLIQNGQFALHNNIAANIVTGTPIGRITVPITDIAPGGWTFERPSTASSTDTVTFTRLGAFTDNPTASPRYEILIQSNGGSPGDAFKDLRKKFNDVNKFASDTQKYTVFFSARSTTGNSFTVSLNVVKNYGTGGDPEEVINIQDFTITPSQQDFSVSFIWGSNAGKVIGPNNDDFCQLAWSLPVNITIGAAMTDFVDLIGEVNITQFPITTDEDFVDRSLVPPIPGFNAETFGLPIISTAKGLDYDYSSVGLISPTGRIVIPDFWLPLDGATIRTDSFFSQGVPCTRLRNALLHPIQPNSNVPLFGTGSQYATSYRLSAGSNAAFIIANNSAIVSAAASDGATPTGFTFLRVSTGVANTSVYNLTSVVQENPAELWIENTLEGATPSSYSSIPSQIFMPQNANAFADNTPFADVNHGERYGTSTVKSLLRTGISSLPSAGSYIVIRTIQSINNVVFWFNVNGAGAQPVVPAPNTYVRINITSQFSNADITYILSRAISGAEVNYISPVPGSAIPPNSYFNFFVGTKSYYVWYSLNDAGTDPNVSGAIGIKVVYTITDTIDTVSFNTITATNRMYYGIPDSTGWIISGHDSQGVVDKLIALRFRKDGNRRDPFLSGSPLYPGSYQFEFQLGNVVSTANSDPLTPQNIYPNYPNPISPAPGLQSRGPGFNAGPGLYSNYAGTVQLNVKNVSFPYMIKY